MRKMYGKTQKNGREIYKWVKCSKVDTTTIQENGFSFFLWCKGLYSQKGKPLKY